MNNYSTLSFDVDSWRTTLEAHGLKKDVVEDFIIREGLPNILDLLARQGVKSTFFLTGREVAFYPGEHRKIVENGHEGANHTFSHHPFFGFMSEEDKKKEILEADRVISGSLAKPVGFRAPGYQIDEVTLKILSELGYLYDSSVLPSFLFYRMFLHSSRQPRHAVSPVLELPVSSSAFFRIPVNGTTIINLGYEWFKINCLLLLKKGIPLNINFHARDGVKSLPKEKGLPFYLYHNKQASLEIIKRVIGFLQENTQLLTCAQFAGKMKEWIL